MSFGPYYCTGEDVPSENLISVGDVNSTTIKSTDKEFRLANKEPLIDVVNDFVWTASPLTNSNDTVPILYAIELRQEQSSIISSALYYINAITSSGFSEKAQQSLDWLLEKCSLGKKNPLDGLKAEIQKFISKGVDEQLLGKYLISYLGMYITRETGFKYSLPFFEGVPHNISNSWQSSAQIKNPITSTLEQSMDWIDKAASTLNIMTPGTYIEKPKYFQYPSEGESLTIKLPLLNTLKKGEKVPYQQNYELLWLLAYQNKPYRTSFSRILPPKLYSVSIPGIKYMPYAYISKMDVNFLGTRRQLPVNTPKGEIVTSIPEAYDVTLTFTSLLADTGNLMISDGFKDIIKVRERE
jgi:hypothetical protein